MRPGLNPSCVMPACQRLPSVLIGMLKLESAARCTSNAVLARVAAGEFSTSLLLCILLLPVVGEGASVVLEGQRVMPARTQVGFGKAFVSCQSCKQAVFDHRLLIIRG